MRRSHQQGGLAGTLRDTDKMGKLRKELHTDDDGELFPAYVPVNWLSLNRFWPA